MLGLSRAYGTTLRRIASPYSSRNATIGSTPLARHAGMTVAAKAARANKTGTAMNVVMSLALTPNNRLAITSQSVRADQSSEDADQCQLHPLPNNKSEDVSAPRS